MPTTVEQLRKRKAENPQAFEQARIAMHTFSHYLFSLYLTLRKGNKNEVKLSKQLQSYSEALEKAAFDPSDPDNREVIDKSLDTLADMDLFFGGAAPTFSNMTVFQHLAENYTDDHGKELEKGLNAVVNYCGFPYDIKAIMTGDPHELSPAEKTERSQRKEAWNEQRSVQREQTLQREAQEHLQHLQEQEDRFERIREINRREDEDLEREAREREQREQREQAEREQAEREQAEHERVQREEEQRRQDERIIRQAENNDRQGGNNNVQAQLLQEALQRRQQEEQRRQEEAAREIRLRTTLTENRNRCMQDAGNQQYPADARWALIAEAVAYERESRYVESHRVPVDTSRIRGDVQRIVSGSALEIAKRDGRLEELAAMTPQEIDAYILAKEREVSRYAEGTPNDPARARNIFEQLDRTWRVSSDSEEYRNLMLEVRNIANLERVTQTDNYYAANAATAYIRKNLNKANSAVGKTRMANALAFLKQTMTPDDFKLYCNSLNAMRHIEHRITNNGLEYDINNKRCIVPEEIGTIKELYDAAKERTIPYAQRDEKPSKRDLAMMTALKTLEAKHRNRGENFVVEREELQEEIEKVMRDPRFVKAYRERPADELCEMAFRGNINTIEGYARPLNPDQQARVDGWRMDKKISDRQAKRQDWENREREKVEKERAVIRAAQEQQRQAEEAARKEAERIRKEQEEARYLQTHKPITKLYKGLIPKALKINRAEAPNEKKELVEEAFEILKDKEGPNYAEQELAEVFEVLDDNYVTVNTRTQTLATLIALSELGFKEAVNPKYNDRMIDTDALQKRVDELKKDPVLREMVENPDTQNLINTSYLESRKQKNLDEAHQDQYFTIHLSTSLLNQYNKNLNQKKAMENLNVADGYHYEEQVRKMVFDRDPKLTEAFGISKVAELVALHEIEKKGGGLNAHVDPKEFRKRVDELKKDEIVTEIGKKLAREPLQKRVEREIQLKQNREQAFAELLDNMYLEELSRRKQAQANQQAPQAPNAGGPGL